MVSRLCVAVCNDASLVPDAGWAHGLPALGSVSDWHIEPVLSSTRPTQSLVCPHTTVEVDVTLTVCTPATFISVVGIGTELVAVTDCVPKVRVTAAGEP